jgi:rhodanese-related sulfurtransferase
MEQSVNMVEHLSPLQGWELALTGKASIVDVRGSAKFALGHPQGALSVPFSQKGLETRLGTVIQDGSPLILIAEDPEQAAAAISQLSESSVFPTLYSLEGGIDAWHANGLPTEVLNEVSPQTASQAATTDETVVLDVREPIEWEMGHVPGALLISLGELRKRLHELPTQKDIIVICEAGVRSSSAASILQAAGLKGISHVPEGTGGYRNSGLPLEFYKE